MAEWTLLVASLLLVYALALSVLLSCAPSVAGCGEYFGHPIRGWRSSGGPMRRLLTLLILALAVPASAQDVTAPVVTITAPTSATTYNAGSTTPLTTVSATVTDAVGATACTWANNRGGSGSTTGTFPSTSTTATIPSTTLIRGNNLVSITCVDAAANTHTDYLLVNSSPANRTISATVRTVYPQDFGARCDGVTDDAAALQAWLDSTNTFGVERTLGLTASVCHFGTPLVVGNNVSAYRHTSIEGISEDASGLVYTGASDQCAIQLRKVAYFTWEKLYVLRSGAKGTTIGICLDAAVAGGEGTQTLTGTFSHISIDGFNIGMRAGGAVASASEIACWHCVFRNNDSGWSSLTFNSLNFWFYGLGIANNGCGLYISGDGPMIVGGHSTGNTTADFCTGGFGTLTISNFRAEVAQRFIDATAGSADRLVVRDSQIQQVGSEPVLINLIGGFVRIEGSEIQGQIAMANAGHLILRDNSGIVAASGLPATVTGTHVKIEYSNNWAYVAGQGGNRFKYPDIEGLVTYGVLTAWRRELNEAADIAGGGEVISSLRGMAFGSTILPKNLRDNATFATSATRAFTFTRTLSVTTTNGSLTIAFASGSMTAADIGKRISIAAATTNCTGAQPNPGAIVARIATIASATTATLTPSQQFSYDPVLCNQQYPTVSSALTATIGENEPDANYLITGLSCNANETVSWSAKATTGFTLTSSNASSTATCDFQIVR